MAMQTRIICQPYSKGNKGVFRAETAIETKCAESAKLRAQKMLENSKKIVGVDVVEQSADAEMGDYAEPIFIARYGVVPLMAD